ncbi:hypothetical protein [Roseofilum sp. Belize Diploria]|uniref:hypothetical protein n=1 Tax=Roseofilum sp. Belize Diploria TaxID=2821501 RepID=UPI001B0222CA|nr:hypothetical protein [Roseofilum sp. Belize Diploria]MBP0011368.1 hypothetical protein [Roseofilum sp. Belize Diploria]
MPILPAFHGKALSRKISITVPHNIESGFEQTTFRPYGWADQGKKVYGERDGKSRQRTSWIAEE